MSHREPNFKFMHRCELCNKEFQYGPHLYDGKVLSGYELLVCKICYDSNWDGWTSLHEEKLLAELAKRGHPVPEKNSKGWLPREILINVKHKNLAH